MWWQAKTTKNFWLYDCGATYRYCYYRHSRSVSYSGLQQRANNTKTVSAVQAYKKALIQYATDEGRYPLNTDGGFCLGTGYPNSACQVYNGSTQYAQNASFNTALGKYLNGSIPSTAIADVKNGAGTVIKRGAKFIQNSTYTLDDQAHPWFIEYMLEGTSTKCPVGPSAGPESGGQWWEFSSTPVDKFETYANGVICMIPMPNPAKL